LLYVTDDSSVSSELFDKYNVDSIIFIKEIGDNVYKMVVYEKDGSISNYC